MDLNTWLVYLLAATGLSLSPGPNGLLALTHGALHGRRKATYTVAGGVAGFVTIIALSMFGIGALLQASVVWLTVLKWAGGLYLVWLGVQVWRSPPIALDAADAAAGANGSANNRANGGRPPARRGLSLFREGALSALTNPKAILFFAAFLPQFIDPARGLVVQFTVMAGTFAAIEFATEMFIASVAHRLAAWLARVGRTFNRACGGLFIAIGALLPLRT